MTACFNYPAVVRLCDKVVLHIDLSLYLLHIYNMNTHNQFKIFRCRKKYIEKIVFTVGGKRWVYNSRQIEKKHGYRQERDDWNLIVTCWVYGDFISENLMVLFFQLVPFGDLPSRWIANFIPVVECWFSGFLPAQLEASDHLKKSGEFFRLLIVACV